MNQQFVSITDFFHIISRYISDSLKKNSKVIDYKQPHELKELFDFTISEEGLPFEDLFKHIKQYLQYAVNSGNHQFFNQLYGGLNLPAFMGEVVAAVTNNSMYTYEVAPVATLIEQEMVQKMCRFSGYDNGDGIFVTGGSNANLIAMFSARNRMFPGTKNDGLYDMPRLSAFISEQSHYSFEHGANLMGLGTSSVYKVKSDENGIMLCDDLERQMNLSQKKGEKPFFVAATAGTTMLGSFDPIEDITGIARKYQAWVHVDGSFGGSFLLSKKYRFLLNGIKNSDSFAWNPHKLMNIPHVCSVILVREKDRLYKNLTRVNDDYLFHESQNTSCDLGKKSLQCGRRADALKLWFSWKYFGDNGYEDRINHLVDIAVYFENKIKSDSRFELMAPRQSLTVCFRIRTRHDQNSDEVNMNIREELKKSGKSMVNFGYINGKFAFRWVVINANTTKQDVDEFFIHMHSKLQNLK